MSRIVDALETAQNRKQNISPRVFPSDPKRFPVKGVLFLIFLCGATLFLIYHLGLYHGHQSKPAVKVQETQPLAELPDVEETAPDEIQTPAPKEPHFFTIQIVTVKEAARAKKEMKSWKRKGKDVFMIQTGKAYVICMEKFADKVSARKGLQELKTRSFIKAYPDAFVRKVQG